MHLLPSKSDKERATGGSGGGAATGNSVRRIALKIDLFGLRLRKQRSPWIRTDKKIRKDTKGTGEKASQRGSKEGRGGLLQKAKWFKPTPTSICWNINYATNKQRPVQPMPMPTWPRAKKEIQNLATDLARAVGHTGLVLSLSLGLRLCQSPAWAKVSCTKL